MGSDIKTIIKNDGYHLIPSFYLPDEGSIPGTTENVRFCLDKFPALMPLAERITEFIKELYPNAKMVRSILFNKNKKTNWHVRWHQDSVICVKEKIEVKGFGPWSVKDGVNHARIPPDYLDSMITARFHFDDANRENGALQLVPGSHKHGFLDLDKKGTMTDHAVTCEAVAGDLLLMKPLILHHSENTSSNRRRMILHLEYIYKELPGDLELVQNP